MEAHTDVLFRTLSDPTRRAIFERLTRDGEQTVRRLTDQLRRVSQPAISEHLGVLKLAGLVRGPPRRPPDPLQRRPAGVFAPLNEWMRAYGAFWRAKFDGLENLLNRMDQ